MVSYAGCGHLPILGKCPGGSASELKFPYNIFIEREAYMEVRAGK